MTAKIYRAVSFNWYITFLFSCYSTDMVVLGLLLGCQSFSTFWFDIFFPCILPRKKQIAFLFLSEGLLLLIDFLLLRVGTFVLLLLLAVSGSLCRLLL